MLDTGLAGKVVIVTGANHGMGAAIASAFAKQGAKVLIHYYRAGAEAYGEIGEKDAEKAAVPGRSYYFKMQTSTPDELIKTIRGSGGECFAHRIRPCRTGKYPQDFRYVRARTRPRRYRRQ